MNDICSSQAAHNIKGWHFLGHRRTPESLLEDILRSVSFQRLEHKQEPLLDFLVNLNTVREARIVR